MKQGFYNLKAHKTINNLLLIIIIIIFLFALAVYFELLPKDFFIFNMEYFGMFYRRAFNYLAICVGLFIVVRREINSKKDAEFILSLVFVNFFIDALGNMMGWYSTGNPYSINWYDNFSHIVGTFVYTIAFYLIYKNIFVGSSKKLLIIASAGTSFAIGTIFGITEYLSDIYGKTHMVGGLEDAISDNIYDFIGVLIASVVIGVYLWVKRRKLSKN